MKLKVRFMRDRRIWEWRWLRRSVDPLPAGSTGYERGAAGGCYITFGPLLLRWAGW